MATSVYEQQRPGRKLVSITPSDTTDFTDGACRMIYVGITGNVDIVPPEGDNIILQDVPVGILNVQAKRINSTSTTAAGLVAIY